MTAETEINDRQAIQILGEVQDLSRTLGDNYSITSRADYEEAAEFLKTIKGKEKALESRRVYLKAPSLESGRRIDEWFKRPLGFLRGIEVRVKDAMLGYRAEEDRRARELQEIANRAAIEEQRRLARIALEEKMKADREAQELDRQAREERDRDRKEKLLLESAARIKLASEASRQIEEEADRIRAPLIRADKPRIQGQQVRRIQTFEVTDFSLVPDQYKQIDSDLVMGAFWKNKVGETSIEIPGIRFFQKEIIASEGRFDPSLDRTLGPKGDD